MFFLRFFTYLEFFRSQNFARLPARFFSSNILFSADSFTSPEIVTVLPPLIAKKGIQGWGKTVTVCSKTPFFFGPFGADLTKNQWFYTSCWASTAGGGKFLSFLHRFVTILQSKTLIFQWKTQNPSTKSPKCSPAAHWSWYSYRFTPPYSK